MGPGSPTYAAPMELRRFDGVEAFLAAAGGFLGAREAEHNLMLGICSNLRDTPETFAGPPYLATVSADDRVVAAALRTPPFRLVLSEVDDPAAIPMLARDLVDQELPGALGPVEHVRAFVEERAALGGPPARLHFSERVFQLTEGVPPPPVPGRPRIAELGDRDLVAAWIDAFMREGLGEADAAGAAANADRWLARIGRTPQLRVDDGAAPARPPGFQFVSDDGQGWTETSIAGYRVKRLSVSRDMGYQVRMVELAPGSRLPEHDHTSSEDVFVLSGHLHTEGHLLGPHDYLHAEPGTHHGELLSPDGCVALIINRAPVPV